MINRDGMADIIYYRRIKDLGLSDEYFFSLPFECQRAIIAAGFEDEMKKNRDDAKKRRALQKYEFEEKVKEKVLTLLKKNK